MEIDQLNQQYKTLKQLYPEEKHEQAEKFIDLAESFSYLPINFSEACELPTSLLLKCLEVIWHQQQVMSDGEFVAERISPRALGYNNSDWLLREQHKIETLNLSALCQEKEDGIAGDFHQFLAKIVTSSPGNVGEGILPTTFYMLPFFQRDLAFSSVYCPSSFEIDDALIDPLLAKNGIDGEQQIQLFIKLSQMKGHSVLLDILPQVGRFAKTVLCQPESFRWMYLPEVLEAVDQEIDEFAEYYLREEVQNEHEKYVFEVALSALRASFHGQESSGNNLFEKVLQQASRDYFYTFVEEELKKDKKADNPDGVSSKKLQDLVFKRIEELSEAEVIHRYKIPADEIQLFAQVIITFTRLEFALCDARRRVSEYFCTFEQQQRIQNLAKSVIRRKVSNLEEKEISSRLQKELIKDLSEEGLWTLPGGSWNSAYHPVFHRISSENYPIFDHFSYQGYWVNAFAGDMDIVTPWYFAFLDKTEDTNLYQPVIDRYLEKLAEIHQRFEPNGFRIDHLDHSADYPTSINHRGCPVSYRAPLQVFAKWQEHISQVDRTFALLAEYMGWGDKNHPHLYHKYQGNQIALGISTDVVGEYRGNAYVMIREANKAIAEFNQANSGNLFSLAHVLDNHDRGHPDILPALSEFTPERALLKWIKCIFTPGGRFAPRPTMFLDGNQTCGDNQKFIDTFLGYKSLERREDPLFFRYFDALMRYSLQQKTLLYGTSQVVENNYQQNGNTKKAQNNLISSWVVYIEDQQDHLPFLVVANEWIDEKNDPIQDQGAITVYLPFGTYVHQEIVLPSAEEVEDIVHVREHFFEQNEENHRSLTDGAKAFTIPFLRNNQVRIFRLGIS